MEAVISLFWHFEAERLHVFIEFKHYSFNSCCDPLNGLEVHSTKLLSDIWIISLFKLLYEFLHSGMLISPLVSEDVL